MDFSLTSEQHAIRDAAREFALGEVDPIVDEYDEAQKFPRDVMMKAGELGFLGIIFPEELGGAGLGYVDYVLVITELSKVDPSVGISVAAHNSLCSNHIYKFGNAEQHKRWLEPLARGEKIGAWSLTEPNAGSDAAGTQSRARKVDGGWILDGAKTFTTHGSVGDICVVFAVSDSEGRRHHNISAFVLERGMEGFRAGKKENKLGIRASDTAEVIMENCFVPDDHLLGNRGRVSFRHCRFSMVGVSRSPLSASGPRWVPTKQPLRIPRNASNLGSPSLASKRSPSCSPRWRLR